MSYGMKPGIDIMVVPILRWTAKRPEREGYYWIRGTKLSSRVTHFYHPHGNAWVTCDYDNGILGGLYGEVEYAGPLPEPKEALT